METFSQIVTVTGGISTVLTLCLLIVKPFREWLLGSKQTKEGQKCLLRADMLRTYYKNRETDTIRQYEKENFLFEYKAYKALGGNSFIDDIHDEVKKWEVIT